MQEKSNTFVLEKYLATEKILVVDDVRKPYSLERLGVAVRKVLDGKP